MSARGGEHAPAGRLLIVDDSPDNLEILSTRLRFRGYAVETATGGREALERVARHAPDLILLDVMMPDLDGFEVTRRVKRNPSLPFIPIILVTARDSTEDKVAGLDAGADDYLTKPINFPELEARVRSMLRIKELQDELGEKNRELEQLSISDGLTGLFNHRHLQELVHEEFERARRTGEPLSVVMLDLDHFKRVNDLYGHQAGDRVLQQLAEILRHTAREIDKLGRYGGEEFLAVLPDTDPEAAAVFAERVREGVARHLFSIGRGEPLRLTVSCGTATYPHPGVYNPWTLVQRADQAMYAAKAAGRNRIARYNQLAA
jgi:diguanylate cyclase (GGDEF)-like protein